MRAVGERDLVFRDTVVSDLSGATRGHASALCCDVTVTCPSPYGVLLCRSRGVAHELTVTTGIDRVTVHELLLARCLHWTHNFGVFHKFRCVHPQKLRSQGPDLPPCSAGEDSHVDALLDVWDLEEDHPRPRPTKRLVRRRRDHVAMLEGRGVLLLGNKARDVSDVRHEDGTNLIRDGARHHRESWQGGRSTPVSAGEFCKSTSSSKAPRSITLPSKTNTSYDA